MIKIYDKYIFLLIFSIYVSANFFINQFNISVGDSTAYLSSGQYKLGFFNLIDLLRNPSILFHFFGYILFNIFFKNIFLVNLLMISLLTFTYFKYFKYINIDSSKIIFLFLTVSPSILIYGIWYSKEIFIYIFFLISIIRFSKKSNFKIFIDPIFILSLLIMFSSKQLLSISVFLIYIFLCIELKYYKNYSKKFFIYSVLFLLFLTFCFFTIQYADLIINESDKHFNKIANTNRRDFFIYNFDFVKKSFEGVYLYFFGPLYEEITTITIMIAYIDKIITTSLLLIIIINGYNKLNLINFLNYFFIILIIFILVVYIQYPQSIQNIGSGLRYKSTAMFIFAIFSLQILQMIRRKL